MKRDLPAHDRRSLVLNVVRKLFLSEVSFQNPPQTKQACSEMTSWRSREESVSEDALRTSDGLFPGRTASNLKENRPETERYLRRLSKPAEPAASSSGCSISLHVRRLQHVRARP